MFKSFESRRNYYVGRVPQPLHAHNIHNGGGQGRVLGAKSKNGIPRILHLPNRASRARSSSPGAPRVIRRWWFRTPKNSIGRRN